MDVVFHPWTLERANTDPVFKRSLADLAVHWAGKENGVVISPVRVL